jgi:hypothetical protein
MNKLVKTQDAIEVYPVRSTLAGLNEKQMLQSLYHSLNLLQASSQCNPISREHQSFVQGPGVFLVKSENLILCKHKRHMSI